MKWLEHWIRYYKVGAVMDRSELKGVVSGPKIGLFAFSLIVVKCAELAQKFFHHRSPKLGLKRH